MIYLSQELRGRGGKEGILWNKWPPVGADTVNLPYLGKNNINTVRLAFRVTLMQSEFTANVVDCL